MLALPKEPEATSPLSLHQLMFIIEFSEIILNKCNVHTGQEEVSKLKNDFVAFYNKNTKMKTPIRVAFLN